MTPGFYLQHFGGWWCPLFQAGEAQGYLEKILWEWIGGPKLCVELCSHKIYMWKSQPPAPENVTVLGDRTFKEIRKVE